MNLNITYIRTILNEEGRSVKNKWKFSKKSGSLLGNANPTSKGN